MKNNLLRTLISCLMMAISLGVNASVLVCQDFTKDYKEEDSKFYQNWDSIPHDCMLLLAGGDYGIEPVIECYDKSGVKYLISLMGPYCPVPNGGIDMYRPMILHLMVGDKELPVKWYEIGYGCWMDNTTYQSNRAVLSQKGKNFLRELFSCKTSSFYIKLAPSGPPFTIHKIGPMVK